MRFNVSVSTAWLTVVLFAAIINTSCGSSRSPTASSDPYAGNWSGSILDEVTGAGTVKFGLVAQPGSGVVGTWAATFPDPSINEGGTVAATVALVPVQFTLGCTQTAVRGAAIVAMTINGNRMNGTYGAVGCTALRRGSLEVTKQ
ncbi:MAG: hypothetical protein C5B57_08805 [Blastocatellia bacterium]|nr:MAG: hypothetical protein C5B57_08805 [Blastocatellia bacterium]